jgi:hypothetical protein
MALDEETRTKGPPETAEAGHAVSETAGQTASI